MAKFEDMLFDLALEAGKSSAWADELRVSAIGFQPPRIADGVGGLDVPSITAGEIELAQLGHMNASTFTRNTEQTITTASYQPISWEAEAKPSKPIMKVMEGTPTKLDVSGWKWPSSLALVTGWAYFAANGTNTRIVRLIAYDSGDVELGTWFGSSVVGSAVATILPLASIVQKPAGTAYFEVNVWQNSGGDLGLIAAHFGAMRVF